MLDISDPAGMYCLTLITRLFCHFEIPKITILSYLHSLKAENLLSSVHVFDSKEFLYRTCSYNLLKGKSNLKMHENVRTYRMYEQRRLRQAWVSTRSRQNLLCSLIQRLRPNVRLLVPLEDCVFKENCVSGDFAHMRQYYYLTSWPI